MRSLSRPDRTVLHCSVVPSWCSLRFDCRDNDSRGYETGLKDIWAARVGSLFPSVGGSTYPFFRWPPKPSSSPNRHMSPASVWTTRTGSGRNVWRNRRTISDLKPLELTWTWGLPIHSTWLGADADASKKVRPRYRVIPARPQLTTCSHTSCISSIVWGHMLFGYRLL